MTPKSHDTPKETLRTAELMRIAGIGRNTLRFYEAQGLIPKPRRTTSGYRVFGRDVLADLDFIKHAKGAGLTLAEIKELLHLGRTDQSTCGKVSQHIEEKIADIDAMVTVLSQKKAFLTTFLGTCGEQQPSTPCDVKRDGFKSSACCK